MNIGRQGPGGSGGRPADSSTATRACGMPGAGFRPADKGQGHAGHTGRQEVLADHALGDVQRARGIVRGFARTSWPLFPDPENPGLSQSPQVLALGRLNLHGFGYSAHGRCMSRRGRLEARGLKRKTGNDKLRHRADKTHQKHQPVPAQLAARCGAGSSIWLGGSTPAPQSRDLRSQRTRQHCVCL